MGLWPCKSERNLPVHLKLAHLIFALNVIIVSVVMFCELCVALMTGNFIFGRGVGQLATCMADVHLLCTVLICRHKIEGGK